MPATLDRSDAQPSPTSPAGESDTETRLLRRLLGRPRSAKEKLWAWLGPAIITVIGGVLRLWDVGRPHQLIFDETYYVKQGWSTVQNGYELRIPEGYEGADADKLFTNNAWPQAYGTDADMVVHPPVGKWLIGWGEQLFGINDSFGWRFAVAICGTLTIFLVGRAAWHLFRSALLANVAALLIAVEGMSFVHSRVGILDGILAFWVVAAFVALLADRDWARRRLAAKVAAAKDSGQFVGAMQLGGPWLGLRPWRWVAGICLGLAIGTKWSGGFFLVAFGLMSVWWDLGARRAVGVRRYYSATFVKDALPALVSMVVTSVVVYVASWWGWFRSTAGYQRDWGAQNPAVKDTGLQPDSSLFAWLPDSLRSLWKYHLDMFNAAASITAPHTYESNPWSWMIQARPVLFFAEYPKRGEEGCGSNECAKIITSLGNVSIWWVATAGIAVLLFMWLLRRDWRAGAILAGLAAGWLPWFAYQERTIFTFYAVVMAPFAVLIVTYLCGMALGSERASAVRRRVGAIAVGAYVTVAVAFFIFWWPIYTAQVVPRGFWAMHNWFPSWI